MPRNTLLTLSWAALLAAFTLVLGCQKQHLHKEAVRGLIEDPYPVAPNTLPPALRMLVWSDTILDEVKVGFEKRYGVKLEIDTFLTNDEAYDRLAKTPTKWDLIMVSQYMADRMRREDLLIPVQRLNDFIYQYIDTSVLNEQADPHMQYFVPFDYTALGVSFNIEYMPGFPRKWDYLTAHKSIPFIFGRIAMPDDMRYALAAAMLYLGIDPASTSPQNLEMAKEMLIANVKTCGLRFIPDEKIKSEMMNNDVLLAITWSAEAAGILRERSNCRFLVPEGKCIMTVDGFSIPKGAPSPEAAALFIEFMLHPYNSLVVANRTLYPSVNMRSMKHADRFLINGPSCMLAAPTDRVHM
ncbi:MAG: spermidine/putrescine ABC transporter substrate-binding protein, partial [Opitutaceae bacterium]